MEYLAYIGITGIEDREKAGKILGVWKEMPKSRILMLGIVVSYKTIAGIQNKRETPSINEIKNMLSMGGGEHHFFALHYYTKLGKMIKGVIFDLYGTLVCREKGFSEILSLLSLNSNVSIEKFEKKFLEIEKNSRVFSLARCGIFGG